MAADSDCLTGDTNRSCGSSCEAIEFCRGTSLMLWLGASLTDLLVRKGAIGPDKEGLRVVGSCPEIERSCLGSGTSVDGRLGN